MENDWPEMDVAYVCEMYPSHMYEGSLCTWDFKYKPMCVINL